MTNKASYVFKDNVHEALWGRERWLVSAHPSSPSIIKGGDVNGKCLSELAPDFPLLVKVIEANTRLSVQVHPNERTAAIVGGEPKTEMWCVLPSPDPNAAPGFIYAGLRSGTTSKDVEIALANNDFENVLVRHEAKPGDIFFIPGGLVHAIGDNVCVYEVQQSSNTTYRLYDWGRVGADGKPRELHIDKALSVIDFSLPPPKPVSTVRCPFFDFSKRQFSKGESISVLPNTFMVITNVKTYETQLLFGDNVFVVQDEGEYFVTVPGKSV